MSQGFGILMQSKRFSANCRSFLGVENSAATSYFEWVERRLLSAYSCYRPSLYLYQPL